MCRGKERSVSASRVNAVSIFCVPLITLPDLSPLLETLLLYHGGSPKEVLCPEFLEAVNEAFLKKKISLPESAVFSLWLRHLPSLEKATLHLLDRLVSVQLNSLEEVACVIKDSLLPQAASHPAIFRVVNEIFNSLTDLFETWFLVACFGEWLDIAAEQLLKAAVQPDPLLWLLAFYYCPQNENQQRTQAMVGDVGIVEVEAVYSHLMMLFSCADLSVRDLEAAVHRITGTEQCCIQHLLTHLLTNFLLFSSGGHMVAQECIYHITETTDTSKEVYSLLTRTAHRLQHHGEENQRTVKLLNELLQKLTLKV
ncbi:hypothetical protein BTVI_07255 [Pitangus sulphuratus]|nr:hypothetical protein BTVI_07255 [Pitangus sulphuratus]